MLEVKELYKSFNHNRKRRGETPVAGVSFSVGDGEIVGLTGKSGAGKSTIARLLCGTLTADSGDVRFEGEVLIGAGKRYHHGLGRRIQLIPQQPFAALDPRQRLGDALTEPLLCHNLVKNRRDAEERVRELLKQVWLDEDILGRLPSQVSGGQAQRIVIARALAVEPRLLIADEATSMLDVSAQAQIFGIFRRLAGEQGISLLLISHDPALMRAAAKRRYHLAEGRLAEITGET
ncbi:MAG: dipeptide/oligopeptide/nickel ABC transporter ATP-binding protein [Treponema sp.]|jgi:ABC-type glutathione transport system ATPase component|nr:dipeptide/oligopeptide/nickel ABC transporter ATP-binding protein [Treponema sp.]